MMDRFMISTGEVAVRLLAAAALGGAVGWERERKDGAAGLRTHMLVCVGASLAMIVSAFGFQDVLGSPGIVLDPSRIAAQVISGIGFLGAGTILFLRPQIIRGLTTAAGLWSVAAVGLAVGGGLYFAAIMATAIILVVLALIKPLERTVFRKVYGRRIIVQFDPKRIGLAQIENVFRAHDLVATEMLAHSSNKDHLDQVKVTFNNRSHQSSILSAIDEIKKMDGVNELTYRM